MASEEVNPMSDPRGSSSLASWFGRIVGLSSVSPDVGLLVLRLSVGLMMAFGHGLGKVPVSERFVSGVAEMGFPMPTLFAWSAALSELVGGIFIALGLLTRPSSLMLLVTMAVAVFLRHGDDPFSKRELGLLYGAACIALAVAGPGRFSIDALIGRRVAKAG
jgi:putative oxidoreductase